MSESFNPHKPYERDQIGDKSEVASTKTGRLTYVNRGRGAIGAMGFGPNNPFFKPEKPARPKPIEFTPEEIAANAARMDARDAELRGEADARIAAAQNPEAPDTSDTINIVGGKVYGGGVEVSGLSADDQARVEAAANIGRDIADRVAEATAHSGAEEDEDGSDSVTVSRDGTVIVRGNPQIGTIVGGQVHRYPR